jgi:hypothetical protein
VIEDEEFTCTVVACKTVLSEATTLPDSSTKFTVAPFTKPLPLMESRAPPALVIGEVAGATTLTLETTGTVGDHAQLSMVIPVPQ